MNRGSRHEDHNIHNKGRLSIARLQHYMNLVTRSGYERRWFRCGGGSFCVSQRRYFSLSPLEFVHFRSFSTIQSGRHSGNVHCHLTYFIGFYWANSCCFFIFRVLRFLDGPSVLSWGQPLFFFLRENHDIK